MVIFTGRLWLIKNGNRVPTGYYRAEGLIKNVNTIEQYRNIDKTHMLQQAGKTVS